MTYLSIIEKFIILFNMLLNFKFILVFSILFILLTLLYIFKVFNNKKYILFMFLSFIILFCISIFSNYETLSITFDDFSTLFFSNIYFPSIYVYVGILIIVFIAFIVSMFNMMLKRVYKIINSIMFVMNNILFVLILNIIAKNKIDIFSPNSLYTCTELVAILELSTGLFIVWLLSLVTVYVTNVICDRLSSKKVYNTNVEINTQDNCNIEIDINDNKFNDKQEDFCTNEVLVQTVSDSDVIENTIVDNIVNEEYTDNNVINDYIEIDTVVNNDIVQNNVLEDNVIENTIVDNIINEEYTDNNVINDYIEIDTVVNNDIVQNIVLEDNVVEVEDNKNGMFNDILNGNIPAIYYDNSVIDNEYELIDPQKVYESRYNEIRRYTTMDVNPVSIVEDINVNDDTLLCINDDIAIENVVENELLIQEKTREEKVKVSEERLAINTVSLDDLDIDNSIESIATDTPILEHDSICLNESDIICKENGTNNYTIDDYKTIIKMLKSLKIHSNSSNIKLDDAVAISLINNYSIEDCLKFKRLLENNLN